LSYPCFFWSKGSPPQPLLAGYSTTSRPDADAEVHQLALIDALAPSGSSPSARLLAMMLHTELCHGAM
jgi:hypothetical protein